MASSPPSQKKSSEPSVSFSSFETSAAIIERTRSKIAKPIHWKSLDEDGARSFIKVPPQRDKRKNLGNNRFRLLYVVVDCPDMSQLYKQESLLQTAADYGWTNERFRFFIKNNTAGSAVIESTESISFIAQTPRDDNYPFFSFSISDKCLEGHQRNPDWVCLFFAGSDTDLDVVESVLCRDPFPNDYVAPLSPDFMILPVALLRWQVDQITAGLTALKDKIREQDEVLLKNMNFKTARTNMFQFKSIRMNFFQMRQMHWMLHRRWSFAQEFAGNLTKCFDRIEKRNSDDGPVAYSAILRDTVQSQEAILGTLLNDLDSTPLRMDTQQTMLDNQTSIMIAKNSDMAAEEARRDSASMRTLAVVALIFLPGTFVAVR
ncbi:hypothetical protein AOQ84DRAFT_302541 [Glonium stellatum]|uniref:Uncharacterized protein n=1 Tax=Glonium stellatum TaxID=574774 RepID=A0A8E2ERI9_9PEZI|nr:hypothetical protein AOQ84DRAFT_302541 [Glonium stellatum]